MGRLPFQIKADRKNLILYSVLFLMPLAVYMGLNDPASTLKVFFLRMGAALLALKMIVSGTVYLPPKKVGAMLLAYTCATLIPVIYSASFSMSFAGIYPFFSYSGLSVICFLVFFMYICSLDVKMADELVRLMLVSCAIACIYGFMQYMGADFLRWKGNFRPRIWSTMGNPNFFAAYIAVMMPAALYMYLNSGRNAWVAVLAVMGIALAMTYSRSGVLAAFAGMSCTAALADRSRMNRKKTVMLLAAAFCAVLVLGVCDFTRLKGILGRLMSAADLRDENISSRLLQWGTGVRMFLSRPFFGWGLNGYYAFFREFMDIRFLDFTSSLSNPGYPHNYLVKILTDSGAVFSAVILAWWVTIFRYAYYNRPAGGYINSAVLGGLTAFFVQNMFGFSVVPTWLAAWVFMGISVAVSGQAVRADFSKCRVRYVLILPVLLLAVFSLRQLYADYLYNKGYFFYEKAVRYAPGIPKYRMAYGKKLFYEKEYGRALDVFEEQIRRAPYFALAYNGAGSVMLKRREYDKAIKYFSEALSRDPYLVDSHVKIGDCYVNTGDLARAGEHYRAALDIDEKLVEVRYNLGVIYFKNSDFAAARSQWEKIFEYTDAHVKARIGLDTIDKMSDARYQMTDKITKDK
ncbi:MAG: O-antigen ligase family protein [Elusimicrobia bacterium]|nr:O-antigen ligase family protein [Elusimicrobiota bacterium]